MVEKEVKFESFFGFALNSAQDGEPVSIGFQFNVTGALKPENPEAMVLQNLENFVYPEIMRRIKKGQLEPDFRLINAQILLFSDYTQNDVMLNDEVRLKLLVKFAKEKSFQKGDPVKNEDIDEVLGIYQDERNNPNAAHIMLVKLKNKWYFAADLIYDREKVRNRFSTAKDFLESVKNNLENKLWGPFIENLFGVTELTIQSILLLRHYNKYSLKQSHKETRDHFQGYCKNGNAPITFSEHYVKLSGLRKKGRYTQGTHGKPFSLKEDEARELLERTLEIIEYSTRVFETVDLLRKPRKGEYIQIGQNT